MPLYEYLCSSCNQRIEVIQSINDAPRTQCPKCGGDMKKLFSAPAIQFKGSGFYKTDYPSSTASSGGSSSPTTAASTASETKSEAKSETKSEPTAAKPDSAKTD
jgi:putative FmdB family regulatory protein